MRKIVAIILVSCCMSSFGENIKVIIDIKAKDENDQRTLSSFIRRELSSLGDILIIAEDGKQDLDLKVILMKTKPNRGYIAAYYFMYYPRWYSDSLPLEDNQKIMLKGLGIISGFSVVTGGQTDVKWIAEQIVIAFDESCEYVRRLF